MLGSPLSTERPRWLRDGLLMVPIGMVGSALMVWRLGRRSLADWDESTYAEIAREISFFHDYIHLHWNYVPWFNKAPLYIWLTSFVFHLSVNEFNARLVSALAGVGVALIIFAIARRLHGTATALVSSIVLVCCYGFLQYARAGQSDMLLTFFLYLGLYAYIRATRGSPRWWFAVGAAFGLAFMAKDAAALVGPLAIALVLLLDGQGRTMLRTRELWLGVGIAALIVLPWHVAMLAWQGPAFIHQYLGNMVVERISNETDGHTGTVLTYLLDIRSRFYPWAYLLPFAAVSYIAVRRSRRPPSWVLPVFAAVVLVVYTAVQTKLAWYIVPAYPALAVLIGTFLVRVARGNQALILAVLAAAALAALWVPSSVPVTPRIWLLGGLAVCIGVAASWPLRRRPLTGPLLATIGLLFLVMTGYRLVGLYVVSPSPVVSLAKSVKLASHRKPNPVRLYIADPATASVNDVSHSLLFYSHRKVSVQVGSDALSSSVRCGQTVPVFMSASDAGQLPADFRLQRTLAKSPFIVGRLTRVCTSGGSTAK